MHLTQLKRWFFSRYFLDSAPGRKVAYVGIFIAFSIIVNMFSIDVTPTMKISFTYFVAFYIGTIFGPIPGFLICFLGDVIGYLLNPSGVYWPLTGICTGLFAFIPGVVMNAVRFRFKGGVYLKAAISVLLMYLSLTCGLGAYSNYLYVKVILYGGVYEKTFRLYLAAKIALSSIVSAVNYFLVFLFIPVFNKSNILKMKIE